jgi:hypothetical protein
MTQPLATRRRLKPNSPRLAGGNRCDFNCLTIHPFPRRAGGYLGWARHAERDGYFGTHHRT